MDNKTKIIIGIVAALLISIWFNYKSYRIDHTPILQDNSQRDSLIQAQTIIEQANAIKKLAEADSSHKVTIINLKNDLIRDSLFKVNIGKVKQYTPAKRNQVYDSIFGKSY